MSTAYPLLEDYLRRLPRGFDSHPQCAIKASIIRDALHGKALADDPALPAPIRSLVASPPPVSTLISEVLSNATLLTICDVHFRGEDRLAWDWMHETTRKLLRTVLYRVLFSVISPERFMAGASHRWGAFRRGTELTLIDTHPGAARMRLIYPTHLHTEMTIHLLTAGLQAAIESTGTHSAGVIVETITPVEAVFLASWS